MTDDLEWFLMSQLPEIQKNMNFLISILLVIAGLLAAIFWRLW